MAKTPQIEGVKEAMRALRKIDPEMRKTFNTNVRAIALPMTNAMQTNYNDDRFPSGTKKKWRGKDGKRLIFPLTSAKASRGVKVKIDTNRRSGAAITVMQTNAGASVFDLASTNNSLGRAFTKKIGRSPSRVMWPTAELHIDEVRKNLVDLIEKVEEDISTELKRRR